jgi:GxxExxY protein
MNSNILYKQESYEIVGACMEVHKQLGRGFLEIVYKDALTYEFQLRNIPFEREKKYNVLYKDIILDSYYFADFVMYGNIILEIKGVSGSSPDAFVKQTLNYLAVSKLKLGIIANFGNESLEYKRVLL